ncbi:hypothetical protein K491DRAFT_731836 [Lophiostoma macrostomum CBS 122681]|uniref:Uncharacterized protein n=1 Tax=Lophiostoma macrostomum CBS 122681 TaxID=1314788 RepID=A0A6A6STD9_9PLEO|nr:hypothetical protein K491DRAFT_731836 [Lophiostoma macrostomum CBS 122681]
MSANEPKTNTPLGRESAPGLPFQYTYDRANLDRLIAQLHFIRNPPGLSNMDPTWNSQRNALRPIHRQPHAMATSSGATHDAMTASAGTQMPASSSLSPHLAQKLSSLGDAVTQGQITPSSFAAATVLVQHFISFVIPLFPENYRFAAPFMVNGISQRIMAELQQRGAGASGPGQMGDGGMDDVVKLVAFTLANRVEVGYTRMPYEHALLEAVAARCVRND